MSYELKEGGKFKYIDEGEGEVLLLLHGLFGALSNWKDVLDKFSPNYRVVIPLMPIYEMPILSTSVEGLADLFMSLFNFRALKRSHYWATL